MTKDDYILLLMKAAGLFLWVTALFAVQDLVNIFVSSWAMSSEMSNAKVRLPGLNIDSPVGSGDSIFGYLFRTSGLIALLKITLYSGIGLYLVKGGNFIFRLLGGGSEENNKLDE